MKRFQTIIQKYITNHQKHKKYLAGVLALSVLVSFGVSSGLIMPAISMTKEDTTESYENEIEQLNYDDDNYDYEDNYYDEDYGIEMYSADGSYNFGRNITGITFSGGGVSQNGNEVTFPADDWSGAVSINYNNLKWSDITFGDADCTWENMPEANKSIVYKLPDEITILKTESGKVNDPTKLWNDFKNEDGNEAYRYASAGTYTIDKDSKTITIKFSEGYLKYLYEKQTAAQGGLNFKAEMHRGNDKDNNKNFDVGNSNISVFFPAREVSFNKNAENVNNEKIKWSLKIQNPGGDATLNEVTDEMFKYADGNYEITPEGAVTINKESGKAVINEGFNGADEIAIVYYTPIKDVYDQRKENGELSNKAELYIEGGEPISKEAKTWLEKDLIKAKISKTGTPSYQINGEKGYIEWTINVERGYGLSLAGYVIEDTGENGFSKAIEGSITIDDNKQFTRDGDKITLGDYSSAVIKYRTPVTADDLKDGDKQFENLATLKPPPEDPPNPPEDPNKPPKNPPPDTPQPAKPTYKKNVFTVDKRGSEKQTDKSKVVWTITINANVDGNKGTLNDFIVEDADFEEMTQGTNISIVGTRNGQPVDNVTLTGSGTTRTISGDADYVTITFERPLKPEEEQAREKLTSGQKTNAENTVTVKDKDGEKVETKGTAEIGPLENYFGKKLLSTDNKTVEGSYTDPAGKNDEENTILDWQIDIENYQNFSGSANTVVDIMSTGGNGGNHFITQEQINDIKITFQTIDGKRTELTANSGAFTVTGEGNNNKYNKFTVKFDESYCKQRGYVRAEIKYSTTAETKNVPKGSTETFSNKANDIPGTDFTFKRTDPSIVPKHKLNLSKAWERDDESSRPDKIKVQLQRKNANGQWEAYPPENSSEWTNNNNGTFTNKTYKYVTESANQTVSDPYTFQWNDLPERSETEANKYYEYRIVEIKDSGSTVAENNAVIGDYRVNYGEESVELNSDKYFHITNTYIKTEIEVQKNWVGDDLTNEQRDPVTVKLEKRIAGNDNWEYVGTETLDSGNKYTVKFDNLDGIDRATGKDIYYRVQETTKIDGYTTSYSDNNKEGINSGMLEVTNTYNQMYVKADKYWDDGTGAVKTIPDDVDSIDLELQWKLKGTGFEDFSDYGNIPLISSDPLRYYESTLSENLSSDDKINIRLEGDGEPKGTIEIYCDGELLIKDDWQFENWQFDKDYTIDKSGQIKIVVNVPDTTGNGYVNARYRIAKKIDSGRKDLTYEWQKANINGAEQHLDKSDPEYKDGFSFRWGNLDKTTSDGRDIIYRVIEKNNSEKYSVSYSRAEISKSGTVKITNKDKEAGSSVKKAIYPNLTSGVDYKSTDTPHKEIKSITSDDLANWPTRNIDGKEYYIFKWKLEFDDAEYVKFEDEVDDENIINPYFDEEFDNSNAKDRFDFVIACKDKDVSGVACNNWYQFKSAIGTTVTDSNKASFSFDNSGVADFKNVQWITYCTAVPKETIDNAMKAENGKYEVINNIKLDGENEFSPAKLTITKEAEKPPSEKLIEKGIIRKEDDDTANAIYKLILNKEGKNLTNGDMIDISDIFEPKSFTVVDDDGTVLSSETGNNLFDVNLSNIVIRELDENGKELRKLNASEYIYLFNSGETETKKPYSISGENASINNDVIVGYNATIYSGIAGFYPWNGYREAFPDDRMRFKVKGVPGEHVNPSVTITSSGITELEIENADVCYGDNGEAEIVIKIIPVPEEKGYTDTVNFNLSIESTLSTMIPTADNTNISIHRTDYNGIKAKGVNISITQASYPVGLEVTYEISGGTPDADVGAITSDANCSIVSASEKYDSQGKATVVLRLNQQVDTTPMQISVINNDNPTVKATATAPEVSKETSLQLSVPDGMPLSIEYTYNFTVNENTPYKKGLDGSDVAIGTSLDQLSPAPTIAMKNKASFQTSNGEESDEHDENEFKISYSTAHIELTEVPVIKKIDVGDHSIELSADFYLAKFNKTDKKWEYVKDVTSVEDTDSGKIISTLKYNDVFESAGKVPTGAKKIEVLENGFNVRNLEKNTLYKLIECTVPNGYVDLGYTADSPVNGKYPYVYYFMYDGDVDNELIKSINTGITGNNTVSNKDITILRDKGTLQVPNNNKFNLVAEKEWGVIPLNSEAVSVELELLWSYKKSSNIPEVTYPLSELGRTDGIKTIAGKDGGQAQWNDLPNGKDGRPIYYYVVEKSYTVKENGTDKKYTLSDDGTYKNGEKVGDFKPIYTGNGLNAGKSDGTAGKVEIKNASKLVVKKIWQNADGTEITEGYPLNEIKFNLYGIKADKTEVQLVTDGVIKELENWQKVIDNNDLSSYEKFRVEEVIVADVEKEVMANYTISDTYNVIDGTGEIILTNKSKVSEVDITVNKVWDDGKEQNTHDGINVKLIRSEKSLTADTLKALNYNSLPEGITVVNDTGVIAEVTLSADNDWTHKWEKLPGKNNNKNCYYYVIENAPSGYEVTYERTGNAITITNSKTTPKTEITINKKWIDGNNADNKRPESLTLKLERSLNGTEWKEVQDVTLTGTGNEWSETVDNLDKCDDNNADYIYRIIEPEVSGYTVKYVNDGKAENGVINLTNTKVVSLKLRKEWSDSDTNNHVDDHIKVNVRRSTDKDTAEDNNLPLMMSITSENNVSTMNIDSEITLTVNRGNVTWSSSDSSVVAISAQGGTIYAMKRASADETSSATIVARSAGKAVITAKCGSETATIEITVTGSQIEPASSETTTTSTTTTKKTTTSTTTTKSAVVSTTTSGEESKKDPETSSTTISGSSTVNNVIVLPNVDTKQYGTYDLSAYDYTKITAIQINMSNIVDSVNGNGGLSTGGDYPSLKASDFVNGSYTVKIISPGNSLSITNYYGLGTIDSITIYLNGAESANVSAQNFSLKPISLGMLGLKRSTESTTPTGKLTEFKDNVATVEMSYNSSSENGAYWYEVLNLPAYDENDNEYYYWVDEDEVSAMGYTVSYQFKDSNDDTTHCIQGNGEITIINTREEAPSVTLPSTGGTGTTWYYITGMALMLIPIVILARRRKKTT